MLIFFEKCLISLFFASFFLLQSMIHEKSISNALGPIVQREELYYKIIFKFPKNTDEICTVGDLYKVISRMASDTKDLKEDPFVVINESSVQKFVKNKSSCYSSFYEKIVDFAANSANRFNDEQSFVFDFILPHVQGIYLLFVVLRKMMLYLLIR